MTFSTTNRALIVAALLLPAMALAGCEQARRVTLPDGETFDCRNVDAEESMAAAARVIVNSTINTTDPAEVEELEQMQAEARAMLDEAHVRIEACRAQGG